MEKMCKNPMAILLQYADGLKATVRAIVALVSCDQVPPTAAIKTGLSITSTRKQ